MKNEAVSNAGFQEQWCIDLNWYTVNGCSLMMLAQDSLCPKCRKRLKKDVSSEDIIQTVSTCCGKKDDFIRADMPVMASVFRYFLATDNKPVGLETLSRELSEWRGTNAGTRPEILKRLLANDCYYGVKKLTTEE